MKTFVAFLSLCLSLTAFAKDYSHEAGEIERRVNEAFGAETSLAQAMNAVAIAPIMREMIAHAPMSSVLLLESDNAILPPERNLRRKALLEKLQAITATPYQLIHLTDLEFQSRYSAAKMRELLLERLAKVVSRGDAAHIAIVLPDLKTSAGAMMTVKAISQIFEARKFHYGDKDSGKDYFLENIEFIFFAESKLDDIPAAFLAQINQVATVNLNDCEPRLITEGK